MTRPQSRRRSGTAICRAAVAQVVTNTMTNDPTIRTAVRQMPDDEVRRLAYSAIGALSVGEIGEAARKDKRLHELLSVFLRPSARDRRRAVERLRDEGLPEAEIIDVVVPEIARRLGREWAEDTISFADVTIAAARLQETVRLLGHPPAKGSSLMPLAGSHPKDRHAVTGGPPKILLIIPRSEHHTLGAFVMADQLRRLGYGVEVAMDLHPKQLGELVRRVPFAMIGITASGRRTLALAKELVETIRTVVVRRTPIVIGGSITELDIDVRQKTGADHVAKTARSALDQCGLRVLTPETLQRVVSVHAD